MEMTNLNEQVAILREASHVERGHTIPHHGSYTVGQHSLDMMSLAWLLMPVVTRNVMLAIMFHDFPERWTGDMPGPTKLGEPMLAKAMAKIEARIEKNMGWRIELTEDERVWVQALDKLECFLWANDQLRMGNANANAIIGNLAAWFNRTQLPTPIADFLNQYRWTRTPDVFPK